MALGRLRINRILSLSGHFSKPKFIKIVNKIKNLALPDRPDRCSRVQAPAECPASLYTPRKAIDLEGSHDDELHQENEPIGRADKNLSGPPSVCNTEPSSGRSGAFFPLELSGP